MTERTYTQAEVDAIRGVIDDIREAAYVSGFDDGWDHGWDQGYDEGEEAGGEAGYQDGWDNAFICMAERGRSASPA